MATQDLTRPYVGRPRDAPLLKGVAAAVVSYNTRDLLAACIDALLAEGPEELVVVDNASTDGSVEVLHVRYPQVTLIANDRNLGYAAAVNQAFRATTCPYVFILNADARVLPGSLRVARDYLAEHPRTALVGPALQTPEGKPCPSCFPFPGTLDWLLANEPVAPMVELVEPLRRRRLRFTPPEGGGAVPWLLGAALLIRRKAFEEVGGFDERYFMYYEEVDFCYRLNAAGWEAHYAPESRVVHVGGASTSQRRAEMAVHHFDSTVRFYRRHYRGPRVWAWLLLMRVKLLARLVRDAYLAHFDPKPRVRKEAAERLAGWRTAMFGRRRGLRDA